MDKLLMILASYTEIGTYNLDFAYNQKQYKLIYAVEKVIISRGKKITLTTKGSLSDNVPKHQVSKHAYV